MKIITSIILAVSAISSSAFAFDAVDPIVDPATQVQAAAYRYLAQNKIKNGKVDRTCRQDQVPGTTDISIVCAGSWSVKSTVGTVHQTFECVATFKGETVVSGPSCHVTSFVPGAR